MEQLSIIATGVYKRAFGDTFDLKQESVDLWIPERDSKIRFPEFLKNVKFNLVKQHRLNHGGETMLTFVVDRRVIEKMVSLYTGHITDTKHEDILQVRSSKYTLELSVVCEHVVRRHRGGAPITIKERYMRIISLTRNRVSYPTTKLHNIHFKHY